MQAQLRFIYQCTLVAAIGGLLFGYDTAVVAGAIGYIEEKYQLSAAMTGWAASCALIGCMIGAMIAGGLSDKLGRRKVLMISAWAFAISSVGIMIPLSLNMFIFFRMIGGIGIGIASILSPMYISEIAPASIRGRLISIYQLGIVIGILLIYFVNAAIAGMHDHQWNVDTGWRWMFGSGLLPSIVFILLLLRAPESPRWLAAQNQWDSATDILEKVNGKTGAAEEVKAIKSSLSEKQGTFSELLRPGLRTALIIGIFLSIFSQVTGINVIMYYAPEIFKATGDGSSSALMQTIWVGGINVLMTLVAIRYVDRLGRKKLLLIGSAGMAVCLAFVGAAFYQQATTGYWVLGGILLYISFFAISLGPLTFVVVAEIFPNSIRGRAMGVAIFFLWLSVYIVSQTFPMLLESIGSAYTFWIYMIMSILAFLFIWRMVPETKGKTLEEIQDLWKPKN
ncbi:sugar porter family MFS transporter [Flavihumibacter sp. UBA7668]|uniref:sugar porter family MFS transporter n=1 Tax=Flavihumibacter sp. UBA7668 TaxID=1946542 RepID=UPI0025C5E328|nr:sugar porter family MFS transporter [Flavihumibacter sp. UBA7668]